MKDFARRNMAVQKYIKKIFLQKLIIVIYKSLKKSYMQICMFLILKNYNNNY